MISEAHGLEEYCHWKQNLNSQAKIYKTCYCVETDIIFVEFVSAHKTQTPFFFIKYCHSTLTLQDKYICHKYKADKLFQEVVSLEYPLSLNKHLNERGKHIKEVDSL